MSECNENYWDCTGARIACALSKQCTKPCEKPCDMGKLVKRTLLAARGSAASHKVGFIIFLVVIILLVLAAIGNLVFNVKIYRVLKGRRRSDRTSAVLAGGDEGIELERK